MIRISLLASGKHKFNVPNLPEKPRALRYDERQEFRFFVRYSEVLGGRSRNSL